MSISAGDRVGPYEIISPLGAGGMGEVWKARDPRLGRTVALKFSKSEFSDRFEREAHAVAALKHPNICTIYDVGPNYLVMELVEGKPLKGPLPLAKAVAYAGQILDALDAAHKQGIIHRDLKPDNILLTSEGIKLLDFGLAKHYGPHEPSDATLTNALTGKAQIVGTLQYMSPEQLQGKQVDTRSDLFSFGCVLYELISGKRAFTGDSMASVIAAVLEREPAPLEIAEPVDRVIKRCLAKDPDERFQNARDLKTALAWAMDQQPPVPQRARRPLLAWAAAACLGFIAIAALWAGWRRPALETKLPMLQVDLDVGSEATEPAISADGLRIAFIADGRLAVRRLDQPNVTRLGGTTGATYPFFSPDGQWVAFFADGKLKKISVEGNVPVTLCDAPNGRGGSWGEDGDIIAALFPSGLFSVSGGGTPRQLATNGIPSRFPQVLPRGKGILFTGTPVGSRQVSAHVLPRNGGNPKLLLLNASPARYTAAGFLVYQQNGTVFAAPMDIDRLELTGAGRPLVSSVESNTTGASNYDISSGGILVYKRGPRQTRTLAWLDSSGRIEPIKAKSADYSFPRLSPDGKRLAVTVTNEGNFRIWIFDFVRETMSRLTTDTERQMIPVWTHDGEYVAYRQEWPVWARSDGSGVAGRLPAGEGTVTPSWFSSDGKWLVLVLNRAETANDLGIASVDRTANTMHLGAVKTLLLQPGSQLGPSISPDGHWLAYLSDETGRREIFVMPFVPDGPAGSGKLQISSDGGIGARWSPTGHELFFLNPNQQVMVVGYVTKGSSFVPGKPRLWSTKRLARVGSSNFDVAPDGRRLLVILDDQEEKPDTLLRVLLNVGDELRQKAAK